ncbi:hypothetical protein ABVT39_002195 [Epinephelus coioides]
MPPPPPLSSRVSTDQTLLLQHHRQPPNCVFPAVMDPSVNRFVDKEDSNGEQNGVISSLRRAAHPALFYFNREKDFMTLVMQLSVHHMQELMKCLEVIKVCLLWSCSVLLSQ